jgi:hypothetical protein
VLTDDNGRFVLARLTPGDYVIAVPSTVVSTPAGASMRGSFDPSNVTVANTPFLLAQDPGMLIDFAALGPNDRSFVVGNQLVATMTPAAPGDDGDRPRIYRTTFYPDSTTAAGSTPIAVRSGEERTGVDLLLRPARTSRISGHVVLGSTEPVDRVIALVYETPHDADLAPSTDIPVAVTIGDDAGRFAFPVLPVGRFVIAARRTSPPRAAEQPKWGYLSITADGVLSDVVVPMHEGFSLSGRLEFAAGERPSPDDIRNIRVGLEPIVRARYPTTGDSADPVPLRAIVDPDGSFVVPHVRPFDYFVRVDTPAPNRWSLRTVTQSDRDVTETIVHIADNMENVVITLTGRPPRLSGRVNNDAGTAALTSVVVFPADAGPLPELATNSRRLRLARVDTTGAFRVSDLPTGDYFVAAVPDEVTGAWATETFLRPLVPTATRIQLRDGDDKIVGLTATRVSR